MKQLKLQSIVSQILYLCGFSEAVNKYDKNITKTGIIDEDTINELEKEQKSILKFNIDVDKPWFYSEGRLNYTSMENQS